MTKVNKFSASTVLSYLELITSTIEIMLNNFGMYFVGTITNEGKTAKKLIDEKLKK